MLNKYFVLNFNSHPVLRKRPILALGVYYVYHRVVELRNW